MLFDRDSRPYFGDVAEQAESRRGSAGPGPARQSRPAAPAFHRRHLCRRAQRPERRRGHDVRDDHGRGVRLLVVGSPGLHLGQARAGHRRRRRAPAAQQVPGRPGRGHHHQGVRAARAALLVARDAGRLHHGPRFRDGRDDRHGVHLLRPVPDHPLLPARIRHPEEPGLRLVVLPLHDRPDRRGHHHAGFRPGLHAWPGRSMAPRKRPCTSACRWACAKWWWRWSPA